MIDTYYKGEFINIVLYDEANGIPGSVWHNEDDSYTIFIDAHMSIEHQQEVLRHELFHIFNGDFYKDNVQEIEYYAHNVGG